MATRVGLALIYKPSLFSGGDYQAIAHEMRKRCDDIAVYILPDTPGAALPPDAAKQPLMSFSPSKPDHFNPPRGRLFCGQKVTKDDQLRLLRKAGVRVPRWVYAKPGLKLSEHEWGPYAIIKPIRFGFASRGRGIELVNTSTFSYQPPALSVLRGDTKTAHIVQQFIDTGEFSEDYRVVTLFGQALYALHRKSLVPLVRPDGETAKRVVDGVVSNAESGPRELHYCYEKDVLAIAMNCYRAIPDVAFQAVDVRRDRNDGKLYILEINPGGQTWNFSSTRASEVPTIDGLRREDQLGAWAIAAEALIENARLFAA